MEAKDNPRVFIGSSLVLSAIVFIHLSFLLKEETLTLLVAFVQMFVLDMLLLPPSLFSKTCGDIVFKNNYFVIDHNMHKTVQKYFVMY